MIISLDELKQYLNITSDEQDNFLFSIVLTADEKIKSYLNRDLELTYYIEVYSGQGVDVLPLNNYPIVSITKIEFLEDYEQDLWYDAEDKKFKFIITNNNTSLRIVNGKFPDGYDNVKIYYIAGYDIIPQDIKFYCLELASLYFKTSFLGSNNVGLTSRNRSGVIENFDLEAEDRILSNLRYYRKINV